MTSAYQSGVCNIGPAEIAYRRRWGDLGVVVAVLLFAALVWTGAPHWTRLFVGLPAATSAVGYLQAYLRFCAAFGAAGVFNFGQRLHLTRVTDKDALKRDRARAFRIFGAAALIGLTVGAVAAVIPI